MKNAPDRKAIESALEQRRFYTDNPRHCRALALLLQRFGVPVLVHGLIEGYGRVTSAHIFRELGVLPVASPHQAAAGDRRRFRHTDKFQG